MDPASAWRADDQRDAEVAVRPVADPRGLRHQLIERRVDEVGELDLRDREQPVERHADRDPDDAGLCERRVDDPLLAELGHPPVGDPEHAAPRADVFAQEHRAVVGHQLVVQGVADRGDDVLLGHASSANTCMSESDGSGSAASHAAAMSPSSSSFTSARSASCPGSSRIPCAARYRPNSTIGS